MRSLTQASALRERRRWLWANRLSFGLKVAASKPRLLVDVSAIIRHDAQTGIQRVVRAVWSELHKRSGNSFTVLPVYATARRGYCYAPVDFLERQNGPLQEIPVAMGKGDRFIGLDLAAHVLPHYRQQLSAWKAHGATIHLVVYDLLPLLRPEWFSSTMVGHFRRWISLLNEHADQAICISDQVAGHVRRHLQSSATAGPQIVRLQLGADIDASLPSRGVAPELSHLVEGLHFRPAILMVGTVEPRKGYDVALNAFDHLWRTRPGDAPDLVIVGSGGWKTKALQAQIRSHQQQGRRLHWLGRVSDECLCRLYEACRGVFMPSRAEGFGLPLLEAAVSRRYVLARDIPVFREQRLSNVAFFDDDSPRALSERLMDLVRLGEAPAAAADLPTWSDCVDRLIAHVGLEGSVDAPSLLRRVS